MPVQTHYEVHVLQGSRWSIHAQFEGGQKEMAVDEGKMLDRQPGIDGVKVIREVYDPAQSTHRDYVIYKTSDMPAAGLDKSDDSDDDAGGDSGWYDDDDDDDFGDDDGFGGSFDDDDDWDDEPKKPKKKKKDLKKTTLTALLVKLLTVSLISLSLALIFTVMTSYVLSGTVLFGHRMEGNFESNVLFVVFVLTFLLTAASLSVTQLKGTTLEEREAKSRAKKQKKQDIAQAKVQANASAAQIREADDAKSNQRDLDRAMEGINEFHIDDEQKVADENETDQRLKSAINGEDGDTNAANATLETDGREAVETLSPHAEKQKKYMMEFLTKTLSGANTDHKKMDNFNKFGVNLFLAGACETLAQSRELDVRSRSKVLADSVRVMGFKKSHAATFADKYEDYLMQDPRYMQMFQAGRNAMNTFYQDEQAAGRHMESALGEWNKPKQKAEQAGPVTVLFTDIAGSTAMTQALGDAGAQKVVRAHNRVVRDALTDWNGKEIKHTGDGIMASFARVTDSVDAAIQMQRHTMAHNQQNPDLPLHLKIGLNAGEPIAEDNDLFGSVVQMSARIVDKAQADEIFVSDIVRGICVGKAFKFINRGGYAMKGFDEDPTLYEVVWREEAAAAE